MLKKITSLLVIIILGLLFLDYKGWIKITPEGKKKATAGIKEAKNFYDSTKKKIEKEILE